MRKNISKNVNIGDDTRVYGDDVETKQESSQWKSLASPRPMTAQVRSNVRAMFIVSLFNHRCAVHYEFAPRGQAVNEAYYLEVLRHLRKALRRKRPEIWTAVRWLLHYDNAPAHTALSFTKFLAKHSLRVFITPYSPNLSPLDFFFSPT
jgi:hypothetical protein